MKPLPDIFVKEEILQNKPCAMNDDQERETGQASLSLIHLATIGIGQGCGNVDQTGNHCPGGVDCQAIEDKFVEDSPPEQGSSSLELMGVLGEVP